MKGVILAYTLRKWPWLMVSPSSLLLLLVPPCEGPVVNVPPTTYNHRRCYGIYRRQLLESRLILFACQRVLSRSLPVEQVEGVPVWRKLEWHTTLVIVHGARKRLWTDTHPPMLLQNEIKRCKICTLSKICTICIIGPALLDPLYYDRKYT